MRERDSRPSGFGVTAAVFGIIASLVVAAVIAVFLITHDTGSPEQAATTFLTDWPTRTFAGMDAVTVNAPEGGVAGPLLAESRQLGMRHLTLTLGQVTQSGGTAQARYTASVTLVTGQVWKYQGQLQLTRQNRTWFVNWTPSDIFPGLQAGQRFVLAGVWGPRAQVLAADGTVLSSPRTIAQSPSLQLVVGNVVRATAAEAKKLGVPYQAGDPVGQGGVQESYQQQLAGPPSPSASRARAPAAPSPTCPAGRERRSGPASTCTTSWPRRRPSGRPRRPGRWMWWSCSHRPGGCSPSSSGPAGSTVHSRAGSRPARPSRWSPPPPSPAPGCARPVPCSARRR